MRNWGGIGGLLFVLATIGMFAAVGDGAGETAAAAKKYFADTDALQIHVIILVAVAGLVWFASALHRAIGSTIATAVHVAAAASYLVLGAVVMAPFEANEFDEFSNDPSLIEIFDNLSYFLLTHSHSLIGMGAIAVGIAVRRSPLLPNWLGWFSIVTGVVGLASAGFFPMLAIWLYLVVVGVFLVLRTPRTDDVIVAG